MDNTTKTTQSYDTHAQAYSEQTADLHPAPEGQKFMQQLRPGASILDLGCGPGRDAKIFSDNGFAVTGIDLSLKMTILAKETSPTSTFRVMDLRTLDFPDKTFDAIWACASYLHVAKQDILHALQEANRVVKPGGILFVGIKQGEGEELTPDLRYGDAEKFWSYFSTEEIRQYIEKAGFEVQELYTVKTSKPTYHSKGIIYVFAKRKSA